MASAFLFYNPLAGDGQILEDVAALEFVLDEECVLCDMTKPETYESALFSMEKDDYLVLCGGDGTLNRFVNLTAGLDIAHEILCFPAGKNNDFARDHHRAYGQNPFLVTEQLKNLPVVTVKKRSYRFLTGIVFDGFRRTYRWPIRYTAPKDLSVTVRTGGRETRFDRVRMAFLMYGRHCCGGLVPAPAQHRGRDHLSLVICCGCSRHRGQHLLRKLRAGADITADPHVTVVPGKDLFLAWNHPIELTVDGEVFSEVTALRVQSRKETNDAKTEI